MEFYKLVWVHWTSFGTPDLSIGLHFCWAGRIDFHIGTGMLSLGIVPLYKLRTGKVIAVSNRWHREKTGSVRAGVP